MRVERDGLVVIIHRPVRIAQNEPDDTTVVVSPGESGIEFERAVIVSDGGLQVVLSLFGGAAIEIEHLVSRVDFNRAVEIGAGVKPIAFTLPGQAAIAIGLSAAQAEVDGAAETITRSVRCAGRIRRPAASVVRLGHLPVQFQSAVVSGQGPLKIAFSFPDYPATKMRFRKARRDAQGAIEIGDRAVIIP